PSQAPMPGIGKANQHVRPAVNIPLPGRASRAQAPTGKPVGLGSLTFPPSGLPAALPCSAALAGLTSAETLAMSGRVAGTPPNQVLTAAPRPTRRGPLQRLNP